MLTPQDIDINALAHLAITAGEAIMDKRGCSATMKSDYSPVTEADLAAHHIICEGLKALYPSVLIISEEGVIGDITACDLWFLIDPLDGTKEFLSDNGEFCVIIALIYRGYPVKSAIYAPATDDLYLADDVASKAKGVEFKSHTLSKKISVRQVSNNPVALQSRSHPEAELEPFYKKRGITEKITCGSALKFALLAEGKADIYARFTELSAWDIAGGQALVEAAGGKMQDHKGMRMSYSPLELRSKGFVAFGSPLDNKTN